MPSLTDSGSEDLLSVNSFSFCRLNISNLLGLSRRGCSCGASVIKMIDAGVVLDFSVALSTGTKVGKKGACVEASVDIKLSETVGWKGVDASSILTSSPPFEL